MRASIDCSTITKSEGAQARCSDQSERNRFSVFGFARISTYIHQHARGSCSRFVVAGVDYEPEKRAGKKLPRNIPALGIVAEFVQGGFRNFGPRRDSFKAPQPVEDLRADERLALEGYRCCSANFNLKPVRRALTGQVRAVEPLRHHAFESLALDFLKVALPMLENKV